MSHYIGIDVGSSFIKAAVLDLDAPSLGRTARVPFPPFLEGLPPAHREVEPGAVAAAVDVLLTRLLAHARSCDGLVLCGQMHGFVLVDGRGEAVSNYISWRDGRIAPEEFARMEERLTGGERDELGGEFRPGLAASLLHWLKQHNALPSGAVTPVSIADYVAGRLCGAMPMMEPTQAAAFGALRLASLDWHRDLIGKLDLQALRWPEVRPACTPVGSWRGAPCFTAVGDQQCALAGALLDEQELSVNVGTGSQVAVITRATAPGDWQTRPYFDGRFLRTITHIPGGRTLTALIQMLSELGGLSEEQAWPRIEAAVRAVPSTDLRASLAFFPGPCGTSGFLQNLHERNMTVGNIFRAAFESMAENYRVCGGRIDPDRSSVRAVLSGGVVRRLDVLRELIANALRLPCRLSPHPEDTLFGLLMLALVSSGRQPDLQTATRAMKGSHADA